MPTFKINLNLKGETRKEIRDFLVHEFLKELPGTGTGVDTSVYYYYVDEIFDGRKIYLKRPARLNKGMDFEVNVEDTNFGIKKKTTLPSHSSILKDLDEKNKENSQEYLKVKNIIERLYNCESVNDKEIRSLEFASGHPIELTLKCIKWLFIEQDVTYWNWSGRAMLFSKL